MQFGVWSYVCAENARPKAGAGGQSLQRQRPSAGLSDENFVLANKNRLQAGAFCVQIQQRR